MDGRDDIVAGSTMTHHEWERPLRTSPGRGRPRTRGRGALNRATRTYEIDHVDRRVQRHGTGPIRVAVAACDEPPEFVAVTDAVIDEAERHLRRGNEIFREVADQFGEADTLSKLGVVCRRSGRLDEARELLERAADLSQASGFRPVEASLPPSSRCHARTRAPEQAGNPCRGGSAHSSGGYPSR